MRQGRLKLDYEDTWYHCYNRIAGMPGEFPFRDAEKEQFIRILKRVSTLYTIRIVSYQVMSNHFHLLLKAPAAEPSPEETCRRYHVFHRGKHTMEPDSPACRIWQARCRDVSWFMRHLQHLFTAWYNRTRSSRRRGSLWADRFKNTILEDGFAVWSCWKYIENNPVRAGLVKNCADYRFCSFGLWHQAGRHPFEDHVNEAMLPVMQGLFGIGSMSEVRGRLDQALAEKAEHESIKAGFTTTVQRRVRHWTSGLVIGSELFVREVMSRYRNADDVHRHRLASSPRHAGPRLHVWRQLRPGEAS